MATDNTLTQHNIAQTEHTEEFSIKEFLFLCLSHWQWFVLSVIVCMASAIYILLSTPPVYQRTATILVKDENSKSFNKAQTMFADLGMNMESNVHNEIQIIQSPDIVMETVKRMSLHVTYQTEGIFHDKTLYGETLPRRVIIQGLPDNEWASMKVEIKDNKTVALSEFVRNDEEIGTKKALLARINLPVATPIGRVTVMPCPTFEAYRKNVGKPIYVTRNTVDGATTSACSRLSATLVDKNASLVDIAFDDIVPERANDFISTLITVYRETWLKDKNQMTVATSNFITDRLGVIERELGDVDSDISSYRSANLIPDEQAVSQFYLSQSQSASQELLQLSTQRAMAQHVRSYLTDTQTFQLLPTNLGVDAQLEEQIVAYNTALLERNALVANSSEKNPLIKDYDMKLVSMRENMVSSIDNFFITIDATIKSMEKVEQRANAHIASNPNQAKYLQSVGRQQKVKETLYIYLLQKREENELSQAFTAYNNRVVTAPHGSKIPVSPKRHMVLLVGLLIGLAIPVSILYLRETTRTTIRGKKDLENVIVPYLGEIPLVYKSINKWYGTQREVVKNQIVVKAGTRNIINEAFRVLRTNMEFMTTPDTKVMAITSFNPGSGKSFIAVNLAVSLAIKGSKVLLLDGDLRHGSTAKYFEKQEKGLSDFLSGRITLEQALLADKDHENLTVIPIGTNPPNPAELLLKPEMKAMIDQMRSKYDYVIVDCPPIDMVADTQIIERFVDRTMFIIRAGLLERAMLPELNKIYQKGRFKNMSLVLNATETSSGRYGYKYGYKYGYHYGYGNSYHYGNDDKEDKKDKA